MNTTHPSPAGDSGAIRLNRYLAQCGLGARRKCDELIQSGHIYVNGRKVTELGTKVTPADSVEYRGTLVKPVRRLEYLAYHKPEGVMVTKTDPEGRETIYQAIAKSGCDVRHLNYAGRLDYDTEGLLLLTNDGDLIHALTHPRYQIKKVYHVSIDRAMNDAEVRLLLEGIESEGQLLHAGAVRSLDGDRRYEVVLFEGKNRQLRRMFEALSRRVQHLRRVTFGSVRLGDLPRGAIRPLTDREIGGLKSAGFTGRVRQ